MNDLVIQQCLKVEVLQMSPLMGKLACTTLGDAFALDKSGFLFCLLVGETSTPLPVVQFIEQHCHLV